MNHSRTFGVIHASRRSYLGPPPSSAIEKVSLIGEVCEGLMTHLETHRSRCPDSFPGSIRVATIENQTVPTTTSVLDKLETQNIITQDGADWMKIALDPFHDYNMNLAGLPDASTGNTVVRCFKSKLTVSRPASVPATDRWDAHFFNLPFFDALTFASRNVTQGNDIEDSGAFDGTCPLGMMNIVTGPSTGEWFNNTTGITTSNIQNITPPLTTPRRSMARVIALGFEVHNDTANLYKSGSVTCYDVPQGDYAMQVYNAPATYNSPAGLPYIASGPAMALRRPPDSVSQAIQSPNSVTYEAADGSYSVVKLDLNHCGYFMPTNMPVVLFGQGGSVSAGGPATAYKELVSTWGSSSTVGPDYYGSSMKYSGAIPYNTEWCYRTTGLHTSGAYYNGLSPETVLTLEVHIFIESLPVNDPSELALATPSAEYDPHALQMYERAVRKLKGGVPVSYNAKGDWWKMVGNVLIDQALPSLANMVLPGSGAVIKTGTQLIKNAKKNNQNNQTKTPMYTNQNVLRRNAREKVVTVKPKTKSKRTDAELLALIKSMNL